MQQPQQHRFEAHSLQAESPSAAARRRQMFPMEPNPHVAQKQRQGDEENAKNTGELAPSPKNARAAVRVDTVFARFLCTKLAIGDFDRLYSRGVVEEGSKRAGRSCLSTILGTKKKRVADGFNLVLRLGQEKAGSSCFCVGK